MIPKLFAVIRLLPGETPELRSAWASPEEAEKIRALEDYRVRDLEGYEGCRHEIREYVPVVLADALEAMASAFFSPERLARDELNAAAAWCDAQDFPLSSIKHAYQSAAAELRRRAADPHLGDSKITPEAP